MRSRTRSLTAERHTQTHFTNTGRKNSVWVYSCGAARSRSHTHAREKNTHKNTYTHTQEEAHNAFFFFWLLITLWLSFCGAFEVQLNKQCPKGILVRKDWEGQVCSPAFLIEQASFILSYVTQTGNEVSFHFDRETEVKTLLSCAVRCKVSAEFFFSLSHLPFSHLSWG